MYVRAIHSVAPCEKAQCCNCADYQLWGSNPCGVTSSSLYPRNHSGKLTDDSVCMYACIYLCNVT